ncbi:MAG: penicillin acylase family protein [Pirellulales bacterium]
MSNPLRFQASGNARSWLMTALVALAAGVATQPQLLVGAEAAAPATAEAPARDAATNDAHPLAQQVTIRRTQYGVPHIQGDSLAAAAFGFGYCQAEDHLPSILRGILGARGQLAATFGPDQDAAGDGKNVAADFHARQYRIYARAAENYHRMDADYRAMVEAFAAGLNFYAERQRANVPEWAPHVTPHDVAAYGLAGVMRFAFDRSSLVRDFLKTQGKAKAAQAKAAGLPGELFDGNADDAQDRVDNGAELGSNMWAFAPSRSQSGRTMLLGNPHQPWAPVSTYYEAHMMVPGRLNFYGSTFVGRPILTSGWNEYLGWSHTVNYPDLEEIYELTLDADRPDHYVFDGSSVPLARDEVSIDIKAADGPRRETRVYWHTPLGPVIYRTDSKAYVLRSACYENIRAYEQWLKMTQTKSYEEFRRVVEMNQIPMFNICYADRAGNIAYLWNGTVPDLPHGAHKAEAVPAARTTDIWTRFHATGELPQLFNPPGGYVQNCNSPPYLTNLHAPLDPAKFPAHFGANDLSLRTQLSLRLVHNDHKFTLDEVWARKHDPTMLVAERVKGDLIEALRASQPTSELEAAIKVIESWDNRVAADSRGATLFGNWWERYYEKGKGGKFAVPWNAAEPTSTPRGLADRERAVKNFLAALEEVTRTYGRADVSWGEAHRLRKGSVDLPVSGGPGTAGCFRVLDFRSDADGRLAANTGDSFVFAVEFSEPPKGYSVLAYSQSEIEGSPHFADQAPLFAAGAMKRVAFTDEQIQAHLLKKYHPGDE